MKYWQMLGMVLIAGSFIIVNLWGLKEIVPGTQVISNSIAGIGILAGMLTIICVVCDYNMRRRK